ncbi:MAG: hypothetical protein ACREMQ_04820 [Longimicrobiales bacterium]
MISAAGVQVGSRPNHEETSAELERLGDEIAELAAHLHAGTYRLLVMLREFDERGGWWSGGFRSCAHWLSWRTSVRCATVSRRARGCKTTSKRRPRRNRSGMLVRTRRAGGLGHRSDGRTGSR